MAEAYGVIHQEVASSTVDLHLEELALNGYSIVRDILTAEELKLASDKLDKIYVQQEHEFGAEGLRAIKEQNLVRCPLAYDRFFLDLACKRIVNEIVSRAIGGGYVTLHLQNGIINRPSEPHHQSSWHRDLPYQEFTSSRPLAVGALFCIDNFSIEMGCTYVLPFSHKTEKMPSPDYIQTHERPAVATAGSVIIFDAMLFHRAGYNSSQNIRRGLNNVYSTPILKQQIDLPTLLQGRYRDTPELEKFLGYSSIVPHSVADYRNRRKEKMHK